MQIQSTKSSGLLNVVRYILALPTGMLVFYIVGAVLLLISNWTNSSSVNAITLFSIILLKNVALATIVYNILPKYKKIGIAIVASIMVLLSGLTAYIYIANYHGQLAGLYIVQILVWLVISAILIFRVDKKIRIMK